MWIYEKKLQYPVNIQKPDPAMAQADHYPAGRLGW